MRRIWDTLTGTLVIGVVSTGAMHVARADTRLTMEEISVMALPGRPPQETRSEYTLWLREDRAARVDSNQRLVLRLDESAFYMIDETQRSVNVLDFGGLPTALSVASPPRRTGETRTIGDWEAERYEMTLELGPGASGTIVLWISDDVEFDLEAYRAFSKAVDGGTGLTAAIAELPGYPVLQESDLGFAQSTVRLLAVSEEPAPAGIYDVPNGYERR
jgi:hypothetical protein